MDPGVRIFAPGSSDSLASAILHLSAIPCGEVCLAIPGLHVRTRFPMQAAIACQPLPRVNGFPSLSTVADPTPESLWLSYLVFRFGLPATASG